MKNVDIAKLTGYSQSAVSKILKGNNNFAKETIFLINNYKNIDGETIINLFKTKEFRNMCNLVIDKSKKNDYKDINQLYRFTMECLNWNERLNNKNDNSLFLTKRTPHVLFRDDLFYILTDIALRYCRNITLKKWVLNLQLFYNNFK